MGLLPPSRTILLLTAEGGGKICQLGIAPPVQWDLMHQGALHHQLGVAGQKAAGQKALFALWPQFPQAATTQTVFGHNAKCLDKDNSHPPKRGTPAPLSA